MFWYSVATFFLCHALLFFFRSYLPELQFLDFWPYAEEEPWYLIFNWMVLIMFEAFEHARVSVARKVLKRDVPFWGKGSILNKVILRLSEDVLRTALWMFPFFCKVMSFKLLFMCVLCAWAYYLFWFFFFQLFSLSTLNKFAKWSEPAVEGWVIFAVRFLLPLLVVLFYDVVLYQMDQKKKNKKK